MTNILANRSRRSFLQGTLASIAAAGVASFRSSPAIAEDAAKPGAQTPTTFQVACMTLPYSAFPLQRALEGIKGAGYEYVAWGTSHQEKGETKRTPVMAHDAAPKYAKDLGQRCRDMGLAPAMMFSTIYPEHEDAISIFTNRIKQAQAAGIGQVLTFGHTKGGNHALWVQRFKQLGPIAKDHGVMIVIKQHGGETGTGEACAKITREIDHPSIKVNYDAGNVMDYLNVDPIPDIQKCAAEVRSFCIKDHRNFPKDEDCGPGFGEIDHYKLLHPVAQTGLAMPLCCENIFAPVVERPKEPEGVDWLAKRAREFLEVVVKGLGAKVG